MDILKTGNRRGEERDYSPFCKYRQFFTNRDDYVKKINGYKQILQRKDKQDIVYIHENNYVPIYYNEVVECFKDFLNELPITTFKLIRDEKR